MNHWTTEQCDKCKLRLEPGEVCPNCGPEVRRRSVHEDSPGRFRTELIPQVAQRERPLRPAIVRAVRAYQRALSAQDSVSTATRRLALFDAQIELESALRADTLALLSDPKPAKGAK